jgi:hypothetical protein
MGVTYSGYHAGIVLKTGYPAKNPVTIAASGTIGPNASYNGDGIYASGYRWSIANYGTVSGASSGTLSMGIYPAGGGAVVNGSSGATTAVIQGARGGVSTVGTATATVINFGTIAASGTKYPNGVSIIGALTNAASGVIDGGVFTTTLLNFGTINFADSEASARTAVWQNSDGAAAVWLMNGTTVVTQAAFASPGPSWHLFAG